MSLTRDELEGEISDLMERLSVSAQRQGWMRAALKDIHDEASKLGAVWKAPARLRLILKKAEKGLKADTAVIEFSPSREAIVLRFSELGPAVERYNETIEALSERPNSCRCIKSVELQEVYRMNEYKREV